MSMNEQETRFHLIDPVLRDKGYNQHQWLKCETRARNVRDERSPAEIIEAIAGHGRAVDEALATLKGLLRDEATSAP